MSSFRQESIKNNIRVDMKRRVRKTYCLGGVFPSERIAIAASSSYEGSNLTKNNPQTQQ